MENNSKDIRKKKEEFKNISFKNPNMIPVVLSFGDGENQISIHKILVPKAFSYQDFLFSIRKKFKLTEKKSMLVQVGEKGIPSLDKTFLSVYKEYKSQEGFLYIKVTTENSFGSEQSIIH
jgi:GABA(A) receptor-associated protein